MIKNKEFINLIENIDSLFSLFEAKFKSSNFQADWKIFTYVIKNQLENKITTTTSLIHYANLPHATGIRRINKLIDQKKIYKKSKTKSGKSFSIHPSSKLVKDFKVFLETYIESKNLKNKVKNYSETMPMSNSIASRYVLYPRIH